MNNTLSNILCGVIGYGISEVSGSKPVREFIDNNFTKKRTLRDLIREFAESRGIYSTDNEFARELHKIASTYEEYDYDALYGE